MELLDSSTRFLGGITENVIDVGYYNRYYCNVVCLSVCLSCSCILLN